MKKTNLDFFHFYLKMSTLKLPQTPRPTCSLSYCQDALLFIIKVCFANTQASLWSAPHTEQAYGACTRW